MRNNLTTTKIAVSVLIVVFIIACLFALRDDRERAMEGEKVEKAGKGMYQRKAEGLVKESGNYPAESNTIVARIMPNDVDGHVPVTVGGKQLQGPALARDSDTMARRENFLIPLREWSDILFGGGVTYRNESEYEGQAAPAWYVGGKQLGTVYLYNHSDLPYGHWKAYGSLGELMKLAKLTGFNGTSGYALIITRAPAAKLQGN